MKVFTNNKIPSIHQSQMTLLVKSLSHFLL